MPNSSWARAMPNAAVPTPPDTRQLVEHYKELHVQSSCAAVHTWRPCATILPYSLNGVK